MPNRFRDAFRICLGVTRLQFRHDFDRPPIASRRLSDAEVPVIIRPVVIAAARPGMVASPAYAEFLREQLAALGRVTMRRMFGKTGVFCDGVMLGMVTDNTFYVRVDDQNRETFKEAAASPPLNYAKRGATIDLAFWRVPERLFDEPDELIAWAQAALAAAHRVAAKRPRPHAAARRSQPAGKRRGDSP